MHKLRIGFATVLFIGALSGCTTNTNPGDVKFLSPVMQLAVGTLNDNNATLDAAAGIYLNAVTTFRNNFGASAFINPGMAALSGPGTISVSLGGIFSYGQAPGTNGVLGAPPAYSPASSVGGYATGFVLTGVSPPVAGTYKVETSVTVNGGMHKWSASATLPASFTTLGNDGGATYVRDSNNDGGGTFTFAAPPAGVTESVVFVSCAAATSPPDPCAAGVGTPVASAEATGATLTATLPAGSLVSGDVYNAFVVGADYPLVEAGPPANAQQRPTLAGAGGTADLTVSAVTTITG